MSESGATARTRGSDVAAGRASGAERIATAFADSRKRAALMPYLMGGHPDLDTSRACLAAAIDAGADLIELGIPFSDPLADGPVIHAAGTQALEAGAAVAGGLDVCRAPSPRVPGGVVFYTHPLLPPGPGGLAPPPAPPRARGVLVPP